MKTNHRQFLFAAAVVALAAVAAADDTGLPQAPVITYGIVRDEYGSPLTTASSATLSLVRNDDRDGRVYAVSSVGIYGSAGMNYRLSLEIDASGPNRDYAVVEGTEMFIKATVGGEAVTLSPSAVFATPAQGTQQRLDFTIGEDADGDGMPDTWEAWVLEMAGRASDAAAIAAFKPGDDADGDGMTNLQEYLAGTDPFLASDLFAVLSFEVIEGTGRAKISFTTAEGRTYRLVATSSLAAPEWVPLASAADVDGELAYANYKGTGRVCTLYVDARLSERFIRVVAE